MEKAGNETEGAGGGGESPRKEDQATKPAKSVSGYNTQGSSRGQQ